jgi:hypothetical protein
LRAPPFNRSYKQPRISASEITEPTALFLQFAQNKFSKDKPVDRLMTVFTLMNLSIASTQLPYPYKAGRMPWSLHELVKALRNAPVGFWLSVNLGALPGSTPAAKQSSTARAARRQCKPIQTQIKGSRLFIRREPSPRSRPAPPTNFKKRPASFEPLLGFDVASHTG